MRSLEISGPAPPSDFGTEPDPPSPVPSGTSLVQPPEQPSLHFRTSADRDEFLAAVASDSAGQFTLFLA